MTSEPETNAIPPIENHVCAFARTDASEDEAALHHVRQETLRDGRARGVAMAVLKAPGGSGDEMSVGAGLPGPATRRPLHGGAVLVAAGTPAKPRRSTAARPVLTPLGSDGRRRMAPPTLPDVAPRKIA